jgi:glutamate synthase (NADPH) small chain
MVSLNAIMVDGTGMCGSCRVTIGGEIKFACVDGPDFDGHQVDFKELMLRQRRFKGEEAAANDRLRPCVQPREAAVRAGQAELQEVSRRWRRTPPRCRARRARALAQLRGGEPRLLDGRCAGGGRALHPVRTPTCIAGCPVSIDIPRFIRHLLVRDLDGALATINETNLFPSVCGRVCPQETQCEASASIGRKLEPVAIGRLERFVGDNAHQPKVEPLRFEQPLGRVAIVGSGPAGPRLAADLVRFGADVTVYEALHVVGGVLQYGIPAFRLPREIIRPRGERLARRWACKFETNKVIGKTFTVQQLMPAWATTRSSSAPVPVRRPSWASRASLPARSTRPTSS